MKPDRLRQGPQEIELKLALPGADPSQLAKQLAQITLLTRRSATRVHLHNVYYDTPEQALRQARIALRIRRVGSDAKPQWLQTLKMGGLGDSALSQRGEWEVPVPDARLDLQALQATPWNNFDPDGSVFQALAPSFSTVFDRTLWVVRKRDGSVVEIALDLGQIEANQTQSPICELELELLAGSPPALFAIARQIARTTAVLPANISKAERGYLLIEGCLDKPLRAQPPSLTPKLPLPEASRRVLREMFCQFTSNLGLLCSSDNPEVVHQARVGWRRFKSALRLFKIAVTGTEMPSWQALQPLLNLLSEVRNFDVACTETLPPIGVAYVAGDSRREQAWHRMERTLAQARTHQRELAREALRQPAVGASLLEITQWLEGLSTARAQDEVSPEFKQPLQPWARRRIKRLHDQLQLALRDTGDPDSQHHARIIAKRMRYSIEAMQPLLPKKRSQRWHEQATELQSSIGAARDVSLAITLVAKLELETGVLDFLHGVAVGRQSEVLQR
ncbi:MAG: CHAD domain-containing protein [Rhodoferax sp.]|uniref:CYTH and CHAD domain-containing protein n=1 Tax=Rhodoferax sp. TaxID=50421 RepID=UPI0014005C47|nr:CYTH and CHAD domain-containing protein [Rhodoferax sp.]NDP40856.1 CHAD domain-containing protein [Rhodoferax sp.]